MTVYKIKRIYESPESDDGYRVLVDRLWPRGISKERAALDEWAKDIAPTNELRQWFGHDPEKFVGFMLLTFSRGRAKITVLMTLKLAIRR